MDLIRKYKQSIAEHNHRVTHGTSDERELAANDEWYNKMFNECLQACYVLLNRVTKESNNTRFMYPVTDWYYDDITRERFQQSFTHTLQQFGIVVRNFGTELDGVVYSDLEWTPYVTK